MKPFLFTTAAALLMLAACSTPGASGQAGTPMDQRAPVTGHELLQAWRAFGTEPFWNVRVAGGTLVFTTPEDQAGRRFSGTHALQPEGGVHYEGSDAGTEFSLDIAVGECNDGMSDNEYRFVSTFQYGDREYKGCAEAAK